MQIATSSIVVHERVRRDMGDLTPLMESMRKYGQLNPVVVTRRHELLAGHRRLMAAKRLGWYTVDVIVIDRDSPVEKLEIELEENVHRKDFSPEELLSGYQRLEKLRRPAIGTRMRVFFARVFGRLFRRRRSARPAPALDAPMDATVGDSDIPDV